MERKEKILSYINSREYVPLKYDEMKNVLAVPDGDEEEFKALLSELISEGRIFLTKKNRYDSYKRAGVIRGKLRCVPYNGCGFVVSEEENVPDIYIPGSEMLDAYNDDTVLAVIDIAKNEKGKNEGHIIGIAERGNSRISCVVKYLEEGYYHLSPDSPKIFASVRVKEEDALGAKEGDRVLIEISEYPQKKVIIGHVVSVFGSADELKSRIDAIITEHSIKREFDPETVKEAEKVPKRVPQKEISKRLDLRDKQIITIDGDDARDFDDAVSVELLDDGRYLLGVHIADVTEYVKPGTALDAEAFERGTSVYLADRVIPMLPFELSNEMCSLKPHVNRLALSVFMKISENGEIEFDRLVKSVIRSAERMTYNITADILENSESRYKRKYAKIMPMLENMKKLSQILFERRQKRGSINFDFPEAKIICDEKGQPVDVVKTGRKISHKIIEEFMLAANETVAELAFWAELPFVYRVHEPPTVEKSEDFNRFLHNFNLGFKGKINKDHPVHPTEFCRILDLIKDKPEEIMISAYMLRSLMKAEYKCENLGHFGLAAKYYCHFTSPIRRYPDLMIHRILKEFIDGKNTAHFAGDVIAAAKHSSETETEAEYCERDVDDLMKTVYMQSFVGAEFPAKVSSVTNFGMFVQLENTVEGLIRLDSMKDDFYEYNEAAKSIIGARKGKSYAVGCDLNVVAVKCDIQARRIDFVRVGDFSGSEIKEEQKKAFEKSKPKNKKSKPYFKYKKKRKSAKGRKK